MIVSFFACFLAVIEDRIALNSAFDFIFEVDHPFSFYVKTKMEIIYMGRVAAP